MFLPSLLHSCSWFAAGLRAVVLNGVPSEKSGVPRRNAKVNNLSTWVSAGGENWVFVFGYRLKRF